jgi:uncharacterized protein DUF5678
MPTAIDLRPYAGQWIAEDAYGEVIAASDSLTELERKLVEKGYAEDKLPAIMRVPDDGSQSLLL